MLDEDEVTPALPAGDTWHFGLGTRCACSQAMSLSGAYELPWSGDSEMDVAHGPLAGREGQGLSGKCARREKVKKRKGG
jgi:hypothetical protein